MIEKPVLMFGGKGGVGKTTCAGATALHWARKGFKTLVISTDPTPSLRDIFEIAPTEKPAKVEENLWLAELGLAEVKAMWDAKFGREVYEVFSSFVSIEYAEFVDFITSILPGLQEEFMVDYIRTLTQNRAYQRIVWDTAPLGQTIHLLNMPEMLREHLRPAPKIYARLKIGGRSKRPILKILEEWSDLSAEDMEFLRSEVAFNLVTIPEALAVRQLDGVFAEFARHGFAFNRVIINNVIRTLDSDFLKTKGAEQKRYIELIRGKGIPTIEVPLFPYEIKGTRRLERVGEALFGQSQNA